METLSIEQLVENLGKRLELKLVAGSISEGTEIARSYVWRPGLLLAGFEEGCCSDRIQLLGRQEMAFFNSISESARVDAVARLCRQPVPCIIVADGVAVPSELTEGAGKANVPLFSTRMSSDEVARELVSELDELLAPQTVVHGTLVDVYGVGLLFTGKSGIGKSECGLDLVANGHRLVADDVVCVTRTPQDYLIGHGGELLKHYMEIRGVGIIDVQAMFGARAIRRRKRIEVEVKLAAWSDLSDYERLGFEDETSEMLGVEIPSVTLPLVLGKNITIISEVIALNYLLKLRGINSARDFDKRQREELARNMMLRRASRGDSE